LGLLLLGLLWGAVAVGATDTTGLDERGWTTGPGATTAAGYAPVLSGGRPFEEPDLRAPLLGTDSTAVDLNEIITRRTLLFYFAPTCSHCRAVGPELAELYGKKKEGMDFIAIASGGSQSAEIKAFMKEFDLPFPAYKDFARKVARGIKASSTPTVLIVEPGEAGGFRTLSEFRPFIPGSGLLVEIQQAAAKGRSPFEPFEPGRYYGARLCGTCHVQEFASWALTHHSVAYWTLYEREKAEDSKCVSCHVTGMGEPKGFQLGDHQSPLTDVTCEACHGAGGPHTGAPLTSVELGAVCVGCHDDDHSVNFELKKGLPHIDHFRASGLSPEEFQAVRTTILDGTAPRPLLAFPEGENVGSDACVSCHKSAARHWKAGPHARARNTLRKKGSQGDVACLTCHAVPNSKTPETPGDFHKGGVGCESCHGPGEQHVAAGGGRENIVGLGETCPECVIETICTNCHTPEQDPDWSLDAALPKVRHTPGK